jgi:hypothetical protein
MVKRSFLISTVSAENIMLCRERHVPRELRVARACSVLYPHYDFIAYFGFVHVVIHLVSAVYIYIYIYICVCVCVCVYSFICY